MKKISSSNKNVPGEDEQKKIEDYFKKIRDSYGIFWQHAPIPFEGGYVLTRWQGVEGTYASYSTQEFLRRDKENPEHVLLEYRLPKSPNIHNGCIRIPVFKESDFFRFRKNGNDVGL